MNERRKSEGELIDSIFADDRTKSQKILDKRKKEDKGKIFIPVKLGKNTTYLLPEGTDVKKWIQNKSRALSEQNKKYLSQEVNLDVHG